jgi:hypothetical protein
MVKISCKAILDREPALHQPSLPDSVYLFDWYAENRMAEPAAPWSGMLDQWERRICEGDLVLHGDSYFTVLVVAGLFGIAFDHGFEDLTPAWCDCVLIVGRGGTLQQP